MDSIDAETTSNTSANAEILPHPRPSSSMEHRVRSGIIRQRQGPIPKKNLVREPALPRPSKIKGRHFQDAQPIAHRLGSSSPNESITCQRSRSRI